MPSNKKLLQAAAGSAGESLYVEDVFSNHLYAGNGSTQTITNGIDLSKEGGLVWMKERSFAQNHHLYDTERGVQNGIFTNLDYGEITWTNALSSFNSTGFSIGANGQINTSTYDYASWTFRKAQKFFDVVTYTGTGVAGRTVAHNLGSAPSMIVVKKTSGQGQWPVYHVSRGIGKELFLNKTAAETAYGDLWEGVTSTNFTISANNQVNFNGDTYVAYLFASDAGGFGDDGTENIIKCGSFSTTGSSTVTLGFEPQWLMVKQTNGLAGWYIWDTMRGWTVGAAGSNNDPSLYANTNGAEVGYGVSIGNPTATGFVTENFASGDYIYIAIRRPMKTPEAGTEVFSVSPSMSGSVQPAFDAPHVVDVGLYRRPAFTQDTHIASRLTGIANLYTNTTAAEVNQVENVWDFMDGWGGWTVTNTDNRAWNFKRATGFMDVVAYRGNESGTFQAVPHNLTVIPELVIIKPRNTGDAWQVGSQFGATQYAFTAFNSSNGYGLRNYNSGYGDYYSAPTSTAVNVIGGLRDENTDFVGYLFATLAGVSKVGTYTGTGADLNVDCGFTGGARFILIKRTDSSGDWYYWDYLRGITAGNDPYLLMNSNAAEVTNTDYIDPLNAGFTVTSSAPVGLNNNGGTYIFLAIA